MQGLESFLFCLESFVRRANAVQVHAQKRRRRNSVFNVTEPYLCLRLQLNAVRQNRCVVEKEKGSHSTVFPAPPV